MNAINHINSIISLGLHEAQERYYNWLLENGKTFTKTDLVPKDHMSNVVVKRCFGNSAILAMNYGYEYYEGYYFPEGFPLALSHAFNMKPGAENIVDCTSQKFDFNVDEWFGVLVPAEVVKKWILEQRYETPLEYYYRNYVKHKFGEGKKLNHLNNEKTKKKQKNGC